MRIAVDAMGGDHAPAPIVEGAVAALLADDQLELILVGDRAQVEPLLALPPAAARRLAIDHTTEVVGMDESPALAMRRPNSSINVCWRLLAEERVDGIVSAGNTGAVVAGGLRTRRFLENILRPGIAVTVPTPSGASVLIDVGANVHPKPEHLFQYGVMGSIFARQICGCQHPTIGLLNVGSEEAKGNELAKRTGTLFQQSAMREAFRGNIEGRDLCRGLVDVIVCDGFVGNIVLKCCEGMVDFVFSVVASELRTTLDREREAAEASLTRLYQRYHYSEFGGAPLLGIDGVCLIAHGESDARAIRRAVEAAQRYVRVNELIVRQTELAFDRTASSQA